MVYSKVAQLLGIDTSASAGFPQLQKGNVFATYLKGYQKTLTSLIDKISTTFAKAPKETKKCGNLDFRETYVTSSKDESTPGDTGFGLFGSDEDKSGMHVNGNANANRINSYTPNSANQNKDVKSLFD